MEAIRQPFVLAVRKTLPKPQRARPRHLEDEVLSRPPRVLLIPAVIVKDPLASPAIMFAAEHGTAVFASHLAHAEQSPVSHGEEVFRNRMPCAGVGQHA